MTARLIAAAALVTVLTMAGIPFIASILITTALVILDHYAGQQPNG